MNDFMTLAKERYSVRKFKDQEVEQEKIDLIIAAGHLAPTAVNNQPQRIYVIKSAEALEKLRSCTRSHFNAPVVFAIGYNRNENWIRSYDGKNSGDIDASIVTTHMMLQAKELGIGSTWVMSFDSLRLKELLNIPEEIELTALLPAGYPADDAEPSVRHFSYRDLGEVLTYL